MSCGTCLVPSVGSFLGVVSSWPVLSTGGPRGLENVDEQLCPESRWQRLLQPLDSSAVPLWARPLCPAGASLPGGAPGRDHRDTGEGLWCDYEGSRGELPGDRLDEWALVRALAGSSCSGETVLALSSWDSRAGS